eukprot:TRINITY_DN18371_c0_g1_i1.p1 TRINITY_DN18371_c0_g1~~TRINITY_DN18371_c0_g1_i1.p1  ORF type:complete len:330 (+),score=93.21 TRINITY_DN18371_c0_g1_i1:64-990(+)
MALDASELRRAMRENAARCSSAFDLLPLRCVCRAWQAEADREDVLAAAPASVLQPQLLHACAQLGAPALAVYFAVADEAERARLSCVRAEAQSNTALLAYRRRYFVRSRVLGECTAAIKTMLLRAIAERRNIVIEQLTAPSSHGVDHHQLRVLLDALADAYPNGRAPTIPRVRLWVSMAADRDGKDKTAGAPAFCPWDTVCLAGNASQYATQLQAVADAVRPWFTSVPERPRDLPMALATVGQRLGFLLLRCDDFMSPTTACAGLLELLQHTAELHMLRGCAVYLTQAGPASFSDMSVELKVGAWTDA